MMSFAEKVDNLIEAGWNALESGCDLASFVSWRLPAPDYISELEWRYHDQAHLFTNLVTDSRNEDLSS